LFTQVSNLKYCVETHSTYLTSTLDLHEGNILLQLPSSINDLQPDQLYQKYGKPQLEQVKRSDGKPLDPWVPTHGVIPIWFGFDRTLSLADSRILLNDFGESSRPAVEARLTHTPLIYRSPEMLVDPKSPVSFPAEIWSLASAIFAIMGQRPIFESWFPEEDEVLAEHVDTLGRLPEEWWAGWANRKNYFNDQLQTPHGQPRRLLEERLEYSMQEPRRETGMAEMKEEEKEDFLLLLRSMLSFKPEERISAQQVLESSWMQKWAKPALESLENIPYT
jgi:serine/threonine protein kinase